MDRTIITATDIATRSRWIDRIGHASAGFGADAGQLERELADEIGRRWRECVRTDERGRPQPGTRPRPEAALRAVLGRPGRRRRGCRSETEHGEAPDGEDARSAGRGAAD